MYANLISENGESRMIPIGPTHFQCTYLAIAITQPVESVYEVANDLSLFEGLPDEGIVLYAFNGQPSTWEELTTHWICDQCGAVVPNDQHCECNGEGRGLRPCPVGVATTGNCSTCQIMCCTESPQSPVQA